MRTKMLCIATASALCLGAVSTGAMAADNSMDNDNAMSCSMSFTLSGWSAAYKTAHGKGTVKCGDETMPVTIDAKGGGLTLGSYKINDGQGEFTNVTSMNQVLGDYAMADAHAGAAKSARGAVMTKGDVTLALSGTGDGWDIGIGFGKFTIKSADNVHHAMDDDADDD